MWAASPPARADDTGNETLRRKQEDDRERDAPVFVRSQNEIRSSLGPRAQRDQRDGLPAVEPDLSVHISQEEAPALSCSRLLAR